MFSGLAPTLKPGFMLVGLPLWVIGVVLTLEAVPIGNVGVVVGQSFQPLKFTDFIGFSLTSSRKTSGRE
jgi:hypothetical protein